MSNKDKLYDKQNPIIINKYTIIKNKKRLKSEKLNFVKKIN